MISADTPSRALDKGTYPQAPCVAWGGLSSHWPRDEMIRSSVNGVSPSGGIRHHTIGFEPTRPLTRPHDGQPDQATIRRTVRRRADNRCQWDLVTDQVTWLPRETTPCPSYGVHAARYDQDGTERWAWLCGPHGTALRRGAQ